MCFKQTGLKQLSEVGIICTANCVKAAECKPSFSVLTDCCDFLASVCSPLVLKVAYDYQKHSKTLYLQQITGCKQVFRRPQINPELTYALF